MSGCVVSSLCASSISVDLPVLGWVGVVSRGGAVRLTPDFGVVDIAAVEGSSEYGVCQGAFTLGCMF